jgi:hypothetical protein
MAAGLRHGSSSVCIDPLACFRSRLKRWKGEHVNTSVSGSCFIQARAQAAILYLCSVLLLFGFAVTAHAAQPDAGIFSTNSDLLTVQLEGYDNMRMSAYQFGTKIGIADTADNALGASRIIGTSDLPGFIKLLKLPSWVASISWHMAADAGSGRASLSPTLRVESKESLFVIKPTDRSVWMLWHKKLD